MHVTTIRLTTKQSRGPGDTLCYFDVQITPHFKIKNMLLRRREDGSLRVSAPHAFGTSTCTFQPEIGTKLTDSAFAAFQDFINGTDRANEHDSTTAR